MNNDQRKIEFLRQALERISVYPYVTTGDAALKGIAISWLEQYQQLCLELDAERVQSGPTIIFEPSAAHMVFASDHSDEPRDRVIQDLDDANLSYWLNKPDEPSAEQLSMDWPGKLVEDHEE